MSEADRRRRDYQRYERKVVGLGAQRSKLVEQLAESHAAFLAKYGNAGLSEDLTKLLILASRAQDADTDVDWVNSFNTVPGVTAAMADELFDARSRISTQTPHSPPTTERATRPEDSLEELLEPGPPEVELAGRFEETLRVTERAESDIVVERALLDPMLLDGETRDAVDHVIVNAQKLATERAGLVWVRALNAHPWFGASKINEIWNAVDAAYSQEEDNKET